MTTGRHTDCLISGGGAKKSGAQGLGEMDKHPAWKMRRKHQAGQRRLLLHLAFLDQRRDEITARISHDMKLIQRNLERVQDSERVIHQDHRNGDMNLNNGGAAARLRQNGLNQIYTDQDFPKPSLYASFHFRHDVDNKDMSGSSKTIDASEIKQDHRPNSSLVKLTPSKFLSPASRRRRRRLVPRSCDFGTTKPSTHCSHFPCRQPKTYHSLGFRLDDSSTDEWISWTDLRKLKTSDTSGQGQDAQLSSKDSVKHKLPVGTKLKPLDVEFREKLLKEEVARRRRLNENNKPPSWEINYGQPTPYKRLRYPVRLKPMELTSW